MDSNPLRVCILGGGVGGLVAAHRLVRANPRLQVTLVERNPEVGGQARSRWQVENEGETEHREHHELCWHVVGKGYACLGPLLADIPDKNGASTVQSHLRPMSRFLYGRSIGDATKFKDEVGQSFVVTPTISSFLGGIEDLGGHLTFKDKVRLAWLWAFMSTCSPERMHQLDDVAWHEMLDGLSDEAKKWIVDPPSIYLGMDTSRLSTAVMFNMFRASRDVPELAANDFWCFDGPINDVWFEPWVKHLVDASVDIKLNTVIDHVETKQDGSILAVHVKRQDSWSAERIEADYFINALSPEQAALLLPACAAQGHLSRLAELGRQVQTQVLFTVDSPIEWQLPSAVILPDSAWCVMVRPEAPLWEGANELGAPDGTQDILSAGIGIWHKPGPLFHKPAKECTHDEIVQEVWYQMHQSKGLMDYLSMPKAFTDARIWHSYEFDDISKRFDTWEPKFSNSTGTLALRPDCRVPDAQVPNLFHGAAYAMTEASIYNMESAAEAGTRAAQSLLEHIGTPAQSPHVTRWEKDPSWIARKLQKFDRWLCSKKIRHPLQVFV